jgi:hypothetical protein
MGISRAHIRKALKICPLLVTLMVTGCGGMKPYVPRNDREEGPKQGLLSGSEGEFVIFRRAAKPDTGEEENKAKAKNGEQQP